MGLHSAIFPQKKAPARSLKPPPIVVPEAGIEPARARGPEDFESSASTNFTTPAQPLIIVKRGMLSIQ